MQPQFNFAREHANHVAFGKYKNDKCLFQFHSHVEIYFVEEGEMDMFVAGKQQLLTAGHVSVALSYDTHAYKTPRESRSAVLLIPQDQCKDFLAKVKGKRLKSPFITNRDVCERLRRYYFLLQESGDNELKQKGYLYVILGIILESVELEENDSPIDTTLAANILHYISHSFAEIDSPAAVAEHFGYSQSYLSRYFKGCFGITLGQYLTIAKLRNALLLMREHQHDITYCAMESGFTSMRTFYRVFHEEFGCSPSEYLAKTNSKSNKP